MIDFGGNYFRPTLDPREVKSNHVEAQSKNVHVKTLVTQSAHHCHISSDGPLLLGTRSRGTTLTVIQNPEDTV